MHASPELEPSPSWGYCRWGGLPAPAAASAVSKERAPILLKGPLGAELYNRHTLKILCSRLLTVVIDRRLSSTICSMLFIAVRVCKE